MLNLFRKYKSFKVDEELLSIIPESQKIDLISSDNIGIGDRIVICSDCKTVHKLSSWTSYRKCINCTSKKVSKKLVLIERQSLAIDGRQDFSSEKIIEDNHLEVPIVVKIAETNEDIDVNLPLQATAEDLIESLLYGSNLVPRPIGRFTIIRESTGLDLLHDKTFYEQGVQKGEILILTPLQDISEETSSLDAPEVEGDISILVRVTPTNEDVDVNVPKDATIEDLIESLIDANIIQRALDRFKIINKNSGEELFYHKTFESHKVNDGDTIIITPFYESEYLLSIKDRIANVPNEILIKGPAYIDEYLKRLDTDTSLIDSKPLNECKLIFVGSGAVGKTSLIKRLVENRFNNDEKKTDGIEITNWSIRSGDKNIKLNIWDFGGQEIMHATHKFFMTRRSVYVLVINPRVQDQYAGDFELSYWLKLINSFGGNSPVIVVINKCDIHGIDIGRGSLTDSFPQIVGFVETSCKLGKGMKEMLSLVEISIKKLNHLDDIIPLSYLKVKERLENINSDYLNYFQYINLCREIDPNLTEKELELLIGLLNDLGVMLNISNNRRLADTQVLNPEWITNGVYSIINSNKLIENKGVINESEISEILDVKRYPTIKERGFIMDMMTHFELCFQMPDLDFTYFIPGAFPKDKPSTIDWKYKDYLHFQFKYDVLPNSIISRFLVKIHASIKNERYWRNGAVIEDKENVALIESIPFERKIAIKVAGSSDKRIFLSYIRKEFEAIHRSISKLKIDSFIALDDNGNYLVSYTDLLSYEQAGIKVYFEPKQKKIYEVKNLLYGIEKRIELSDLKTELMSGQLKKVLSTLNSAFPNSNELILLLARYNKIELESHTGTIEERFYRREENSIMSAALKIINDLQRDIGNSQSIVFT